MTLPGLSGRRVLVTGASRGIGEAVASAFVAAGAVVHVLAEDGAVEDTGRRIGAAAAHVADIADERAVARAVAAIGPLDVLVNNAGLERMTPIDDPDATMIAVFRRVIEVNVVGTTIVTQAVLPQLGPGARIVNTASIWGRVAEPLFSAYVASKHAVIGLTKTWAKELGPRGIAVNAVAPGWVRTEGSMRSASVIAARIGRPESDVIGAVEAAQALPGGLMEPPDVAGPYLYLASDLAANVTGQTLGVDRGEVPW
ncbi:SDR family NAD(P)-dependent oxidoreductase [Oharaeibacter diazotrophicus]|uniref:NAD(P)-dependent dehydrogenase (Short-subunit alcohol dehydrogenase family) n=1 Tax=Oharaeibacter diazotrophicus TaxID=1920512 RepID=A0A4R6RL47_9HYPH|nr:SDR family oxidoreductase [Oharaeibacter diazotrophicus]TDP87202.1 NAD(P)-dependent dehydrogenase (short-subunit alcohol dehydrogenase family) [Oharaeibacter diazotrophicus]BBE70855.1 pyridoxal 4-dehydrogenase [Pleomorphomonas sp. SM30]GLS77604.1 3-hydroxybutyrate dehydrogenase [Oharaeibacter diazotrophicus]